jgi:hypothetical protein
LQGVTALLSVFIRAELLHQALCALSSDGISAMERLAHLLVCPLYQRTVTDLQIQSVGIDSSQSDRIVSDRFFSHRGRSNIVPSQLHHKIYVAVMHRKGTVE